MENPTNLPDAQFEVMKKTLSPNAFNAFIQSQPKKSATPLKPFSEEAFEKAMTESRSIQEIFDQDGTCGFYFDEAGMELYCGMMARNKGVVSWTSKAGGAIGETAYLGGYYFNAQGDKKKFVKFDKPTKSRQEAEAKVNELESKVIF